MVLEERGGGEVCPTSNLMLIPTALAQLERRAGATPLKALRKFAELYRAVHIVES